MEKDRNIIDGCQNPYGGGEATMVPLNLLPALAVYKDMMDKEKIKCLQWKC